MVKINKVLLCGAKQIGKSAILEQLIYGHVTRDSVYAQIRNSQYRIMVILIKTIKTFVGLNSAGLLPYNRRHI